MTLEQFTDELQMQAVKQGLRKGRQQGLQEGRQKGLQKGLEKGRQEGARDVLLRQLRRRLGTLPEKLSRQIERLDDTAMLSLGDALFDFTAPADAERWLAKHNKK